MGDLLRVKVDERVYGWHRVRRVSIESGTYKLGPRDGTLSVRTERTGAAAKAGHNLLLEVTAWEATLEVGETASVELTADPTSLRVREGSGGMQALGDDDKANIEQTIDDDVLKRRGITFRSTAVKAAADGRLEVEGELTLADTTRPFAFDVTVAGGRLAAVAVVKQTDFGMKPYSGLFGALKVVDEVKVELDAGLPQSR
jgi:polyisoprenoid-binding protein YceI